MPSLLIVDDEKAGLETLVAAVQKELPADEATVYRWSPSQADKNALQAFEQKLHKDTLLVIADQELTSQGLTGLFGSTIVDWCQERAIPVGLFSRIHSTSLPKSPELFEIHIPSDPDKAAPEIASLFRGFRSIGEAIAASSDYLTMRSPSAVLARVLGDLETESQLSLYTGGLGATSGALMSRVSTKSSDEQKGALLSYVVGHLLLTVLRFPGPIISLTALKGYLASDEASASDVKALFESALYTGPFADMDTYHWLSAVDRILEDLEPPKDQAATRGEFNRLRLEGKLKRKLHRHECPICNGVNGGFYCPIPKIRSTVCILPQCSVSSNSWIPQGASLCRIERQFFEEWAPLLGL